MKTILVTGGAGFIGSNLIAKLLSSRRVAKVVCVDNLNDFYSPKVKLANLASFKKHPRLSFYKKDIRDFDSLHKIFKKEKPEAVVHLAAQANTRLAVNDPREYQSNNVDGTLNLFELAKDYQVKNFVFASSSSVYGNKNKIPFNEEDRTDFPISPYGVTKKTGELLAHAYHHNFGLNITCLRFFTVYGENNRPDMVMYKWARNILTNQPIEMSGQGDRRRDYTYVGDIVTGIVMALKKPLGFEVINLGNSRPVSLKELLKIFEKVSGKKAMVKFRPSHQASVENTFTDISKAKKVLGWEPKINIEQGVTKLVSWFRGCHLKELG